jgi:hypothetical protein
MSFIEVTIPYSNSAVLEERHWHRLTEEVYDWLVENISEHECVTQEECPWTWDYRGNKEVTFIFKDKEKALLFKLTWG